MDLLSLYVVLMHTNALTPYGKMGYFTNSLEWFQIHTGYSCINGTEPQRQKSDGEENSAKYSVYQKECDRAVFYHQDYSVSS